MNLKGSRVRYTWEGWRKKREEQKDVIIISKDIIFKKNNNREKQILILARFHIIPMPNTYSFNFLFLFHSISSKWCIYFHFQHKLNLFIFPTPPQIWTPFQLSSLSCLWNTHTLTQFLVTGLVLGDWSQPSIYHLTSCISTWPSRYMDMHTFTRTHSLILTYTHTHICNMYLYKLLLSYDYTLQNIILKDAHVLGNHLLPGQ